MLNPEIAQARLKEYQVTDWQKIRLEKLLKLPAKLRSIGCGIFGHDDNGKLFKRDDSAISDRAEYQKSRRIEACRSTQNIYHPLPPIRAHSRSHLAELPQLDVSNRLQPPLLPRTHRRCLSSKTRLVVPTPVGCG